MKSRRGGLFFRANGARVDLDADVFQVLERLQQVAIVGRQAGLVCDNADDGSFVLGTYPPDMQVRNLAVAIAFDGTLNRKWFLGRDIPVDQDMTCFFGKPPCPPQDEGSADKTHEGIRPHPAPLSGNQQGGDGQHGRQGIRHDMDIGGPHIVVVEVSDTAIMGVVIGVWSSQKPGAGQIHDQPDGGDE